MLQKQGSYLNITKLNRAGINACPLIKQIMYIARKSFSNYQKGDEVKEEDAKRVGSLYCTKSNDAGVSIEVTIGETTNQASDTNTENNITGNTANTPNLEEMRYADLKALADSKGIKYKHNISTVALIELLKNN